MHPLFTLRVLTACAVCVAFASTTSAQTTHEEIDKRIRERWQQLLSEEASRAGKTLTAERLTGSEEEKRRIYTAAIDRLMQEDLGVDDRALVTETVREADRQYIDQLREQNADTKTAKSVDTRSTNPVTAGLSERSGFTDLLAVALTGKNFISADETAVTLSLNALALYSLADPEVYSELYRYQQQSTLRRLSGSVTFGAKVPEKEITGISNLPDVDKLFDVFAWDVKLRILGDRDPRSPRWYPLTLGRTGTQLVVITGLVLIEDLELVRSLLDDAMGRWVTDVKRRMARSAQLSVKTSGTHLTKEAGKNKYTGELLFDAGLGAKADFTANVLYSVTDDVRLGAERLFQVKQWTVNASLTTQFAEGAIVRGRAVDWNVGLALIRFANKTSLPIDVQNTWKLFTTFEVPVSTAAKMPLSIVYSNDPNALTKQKYVSGFVGINYDFSALGTLFARGN